MDKEIDYSKLTLQELLEHTERIIQLLAQNVLDELKRIERENKNGKKGT